MFSLILGVLPLHNGSLALNERVQSVLSLSHPVWIFLQRLFLSLFPEPPESSGLISPVRAYSGAYYWHACVLSHVQLFVTPWTVAHQGPPSMEFSRQEYWKCEVKVTQSCLTLCDPMDYIYSPWNSPDQNTGVGSLSLLQRIFPTQGSNRCPLFCRQILYQLSYQGSPFWTLALLNIYQT